MTTKTQKAVASAEGLGGVVTKFPVALAAFVVLLIFLPGGITFPWQQVVLVILVWGSLASGLNIIVGWCGLLDLGYVAFFIVGAYFSALFTTNVIDPNSEGVPWWTLPVELVGAMTAAALLGALVGFPTLRLRGDYLAIMTLGFHQVIHAASINWIGLTGGSAGVPGIPPMSIGEYQFLTTEAYVYAAGAMAALLITLSWSLNRSHVGRAWVAIREDELVAESIGVPSSRYKLLAYVVGAIFAGGIGVIFAHSQRYISPDSFSLMENVVVLLLIVVGGAGTVWGPLVGSAIWYVALQQLTQFQFVIDNPQSRLMILSLLLIVIMIVRPQGLLGRQGGFAVGAA